MLFRQEWDVAFQLFSKSCQGILSGKMTFQQPVCQMGLLKNNNNKKATHPGDKGGNIMGYNVFCSADSHDAHTYWLQEIEEPQKKKGR